MAKSKAEQYADRFDADQLEEIIEVLDTLYDEGQDCINPIDGKEVSDPEYDCFRPRLKKLRPDSRIFTTPSATKRKVQGAMIKHDPPMVSIEKANGSDRRERLAKFLQESMTRAGYTSKVHNKRDNTDHAIFAQSYKRDGVAVAIKWEKGELVSAGLRPRDGVNGEDVTANIIHVQGVPQTLPLPLDIEIRGELECQIATFKKVNDSLTAAGEDTYANPRMFTSGTIRKMKDADPKRIANLNFTGYIVIGHHDPDLVTAIQQAKWVNKTLKVNFVRKEPFRGSQLLVMEKNAATLPYEVDGVVVEVNNFEDCEQLGTHGDNPIGNPRGKMAWKFNERDYAATVKNIRWQTGRTGRVTPVLEFDAVLIDGTNVVNCTASNLGIVKGLGLGLAAKITIIKSGKIIPKIYSVKKKAPKVGHPDKCPSCGSTLSVVPGGGTSTICGKEVDVMDLVCKSDACPAQNIQAFSHYLKTIGCKGVGGAKIDQLLSAGAVQRFGDFYNLTTGQLQKAGFSERQSVLILASIWKLRSPEKERDNKALLKKICKAQGKGLKVSMQMFIESLGIPQSGKGTARRLADTFGTMDSLFDATKDELLAVDDVGPKTADSLFSFFAAKKNDIKYMMQFVKIEAPATGPLAGMTFVFTGGFDGGKKKWQYLVESNGGKIGSSVSKKTDYVVIGTDAGSKETKARELNQKTSKPHLIEDTAELEAMVK